MNERLQISEIPHVHFPQNPEKINIAGFEVFKYIDGLDMKKYIKALSDRNNLRDYDQVLVNWRGGWELFTTLKDLQGYWKWPSICEYHRTKYGVSVTKPVDNSLRSKKVLLVDDIFDRGKTILEILRSLGSESKAVVAVWKEGVPGQIKDPRVDAGVIVDDKWLGGWGMNMGFDNEKEIFRKHSGIVVKP